MDQCLPQMDKRPTVENNFTMPGRIARGTLIIVCLMALSTVSRDFQTNACDSHTSFSGSAPVMPSVPEQYSVMVEANILQKHRTAEVEEHYDGVNGRAAVRMTTNGSTTSAIFNFKTETQYTILPSGACKAGKITHSTAARDLVKLYTVGGSQWTSVKEAFRPGSGGNTTYVGKERVRGIPVNHWTNCQTLRDSGTWFQADYYFSDPDFTMAGGREQVPVRAMFQTNLIDGHSKLPESWVLIPGSTAHHVYELTFFRPGPEFNEEVFRIPAGAVCTEERKSLVMPTLPHHFQVDIEVVIPGSTRKQEETLSYNKDMQTVETVKYVALRDTKNKIKHATITTVEDFRNQVVFVLKETNCSVLAMKKDYAADMMSHGLNLHYIAHSMLDYNYQGRKEIRGLLVEVWDTKDVGIGMEIYFLAKDADVENANELNTDSQAEMVATPVGMLLRNDDGLNSSQLPLIWREIVSPWLDDQGRWDDPKLSNNQVFDMNVKEKYVHFYNFDADRPNYQNLNKCFPEGEKSFAFIIVNAPMDDIEGQWETFSMAIKSAIVHSTGLSIIQINNMWLDYFLYKRMSSCAVVAFTLLGLAPGPHTPLLTLKEADTKIKSAIQNGLHFQIQFSNISKLFSVIYYDMVYTKDASIPATCNGTLLDLSPTLSPTRAIRNKIRHMESGIQEEYQGDSKTNLYSPSVVAGIAVTTLLLGAFLCLVAVYILYKKRHPEQAFIFFKMTE